MFDLSLPFVLLFVLSRDIQIDTNRYTTTPRLKRSVVLTRHETADDLLSAVYPYLITIDPSSKEPAVGAGALLLSEPNR